ncbi:MAG: ATP-binding protein, partial [Blastocatellia bacterium]
MSVHRLIVRSPQGDLAQGTAWAAAPGFVCTAFHVVGHCGDRRWMHELIDGVSYWLDDGVEARSITPAMFDADADLGLLATKGDLEEVLPLAEFSRNNVRWQSRGYPGFHDGREFTVSGEVVDLRDGEGARAIQLRLAQGADADWGGISGAPVVEQPVVIGVVTNVTEGTATAWAAPVEAVRRLIDLAGLSVKIAHAVGHDVSPDKPLGGYEGMDRRQLGDIVESLVRKYPDDQVLADLRAELLRNQPARVAAQLSLRQIAALRDYDVIPVREGGRVIRPAATFEFAQILGESKRFGGRRNELAKLDRFASETKSGYFFVTGISGFGKTSTLARWIDILRRRGDTICFHFFTLRMPESVNAEHSLGSLVEQLLAAHGLGGDPPRDRARLQALYVDLLALPAPNGRPLIVLLDGLDEAFETLRPSSTMFPSTLGNGVHVVFSARKTADREWLKVVELELTEDAQIELGQLGASDIQEILERAGLVSDATLVARLEEKTDGDPFYVADVARALADAGGAIEVLDDLPATHSDYLRAWWNEAVRRVAQPGFVDLMGTLAALRAPLGSAELAAISTDDQLQNATIGVLLEEAARYVEDDRRARYWLHHDRIRKFVRDTLKDDMRDYDARVRDFALRWNDAHASPEARSYGRQHVVAHLLAEDRFEAALDLIDAEFIAARWREDGTYSALLSDLDALLDWAGDRVDQRIPACNALALAVMRESARDLMRHLPDPLCRAWVRLEGKTRPLEMLASLPSHRGEARVQLLAVAGEILELAGDGQAGNADRAVAGELLARLIGLLPLVRTNTWTLDALAELCRLVATHPFGAGPAQALLKQGLAYASQIESAPWKAATLAHLAAAALPSDIAFSARLIEDVQTFLPNLPLADRAAVLAIAMPTHRALDARIDNLALLTVEELARAPAESVLARSPLDNLLSAWAPDPGAAESVQSLIAAREKGQPWLNGHVHYATDPRDFPIDLLCKLGLEDVAWTKLERELQAASPDINKLLEAHEHMPARRPVLLEAMSDLSIDFPTMPGLSSALALAGRWTDVRRVIVELNEKDSGEALSDCLMATLTREESVERERTIDLIIDQLRQIPAEGAAGSAGTAAHALAKAGHRKSLDVLKLAFQSALSDLSEGDADETRQLVAAGLAKEGLVDDAIDLAVGCKWWHRRTITLLASIRALPSGSPDRARVAGYLGEIMKTAEKDSFLLESMRATCAAALELGPAQTDEALQLVEAAESAYYEKPPSWLNDQLLVQLELQRTRTKLDLAAGAARGGQLAEWVREMASGGFGELDGSVFEPLFSLCAALIDDGSAQQGLFDHVLTWAEGIPLEGKARIKLAAAAGAAAASFDTGQAAELMRRGMEDLAKLEDESKVPRDLLFFMTLMSDLTRTGDEPVWSQPLLELEGALVDTCKKFDEDVLADLLGRLSEQMFELANDARQLQYVAPKYLYGLLALPTAREAALTRSVDYVVTELEKRRA